MTKQVDDWKIRRRLLTSAFHFQILESFFDVFNEHSQALLVNFTNAVFEATKLLSGPIDVFPILGNATLDIICGCFISQNQNIIFTVMLITFFIPMMYHSTL